MWLIEARQSLRGLFARANRRAAAAAVAVLALGLAFMGTVLALVAPFTIAPLPYTNAARLAFLQVSSNGVPAGTRLPTLDDWTSDPLVEVIAPVGRRVSFRVESPRGAAFLVVHEVSREFLTALGLVVPSEGWEPRAELGATPMLLTDIGRRTLGNEQAAVGTTLRHERGALIVAARLPASFVFPDPKVAHDVDGLVPYRPHTSILADEAVDGEGKTFGGFSASYIVRTAEGAPMPALAERLAATTPREYVKLALEPLSVRMTAHVRGFAWGALGLGALILLICAGNLTNISLAHAAFRLPEFVTRCALGASQLQVLRLLIVERAFVVMAAVPLGVWMTWMSVRLAAPSVPDELLTFGAPQLSVQIVGVLATGGLIIGLAALGPASWLLWGRASQARVLPGSVGVRGMAPRSLFVATQCALVMVLSVGAGLLLHSQHRLANQETGFDRSAAAVSVSYPGSQRRSVDLMPTVREAVGNLSRLPGVHHVGLTSGTLVAEGISKGQLTIAGRHVVAAFQSVSPEFFRAAGMSVVKGRGLDGSDLGGAVVVNESFARAFLASRDSPLGQLVNRGARSFEIVGVVRDAFDKQLDVAPAPTVYLVLDRFGGGNLTFVVSPGSAVAGHEAATRRILAAGHPLAVVRPVGTIGGRFSDSIRDRTFATQLLTTFSVGGVFVCLSGIAGLVAFIVGRRTHEIAVRMSLGAGPADVLRLVLREPLASAVAGLAAGLLGGQWLSRYLEHLLYGLAPGDWRTASAVATLVVIAVALAALLAARNAVGISPTAGLRES